MNQFLRGLFTELLFPVFSLSVLCHSVFLHFYFIWHMYRSFLCFFLSTFFFICLSFIFFNFILITFLYAYCFHLDMLLDRRISLSLSLSKDPFSQFCFYFLFPNFHSLCLFTSISPCPLLKKHQRKDQGPLFDLACVKTQKSKLSFLKNNLDSK